MVLYMLFIGNHVNTKSMAAFIRYVDPPIFHIPKTNFPSQKHSKILHSAPIDFCNTYKLLSTTVLPSEKIMLHTCNDDMRFCPRLPFLIGCVGLGPSFDSGRQKNVPFVNQLEM